MIKIDIERLKKLNLLAGELKHQGIAQNNEDAAALAVTMVGEEEEQCLADMHINDNQSLMIKEIIKNKPELKEATKETAQEAQQQIPIVPVVQGLSRSEMETILQDFATAFAHEFTLLQQKIEETNTQLKQILNSQLSQLSQSTVQNIVQEQVPVQRTLEQQPISQPTAPVHPRTGNFATDDVSIEKMFYFGKK